MDGKPYTATLAGTADGQVIPAFALAFDLCRCNGRRINAKVREFSDRRLTIEGSLLRVSTIKNLPAWTMPVVMCLMRVRDKNRTGTYNQQEVRELRSALPKTLRQLNGTRLWLYIGATEAYELNRNKRDGVVRLCAEGLEDRTARIAAFLGAERVVSAETDFKRLLPCSYQTWERIADFTVPQTYEYVGGKQIRLEGSPFDA
jgi:hypothetical protein